MDNGLKESSVYTDFNQYDRMRDMAKQDQDQALPEVAQQFESIFLQMILKSMRDVNKVFSEGNFLSSEKVEFYRGMYDSQLSVSLSDEGGLGLAEIIVQQLSSAKGDSENTPLKALPTVKHAKPENSYPPQITTPSSEQLPENFGNPVDFVKALWPHAKKAAQEFGVNAKVLIAQAALETGWGKSIIKHADGKSSNNLFNIKANNHWQDDKVTVSTLEYRDGVAGKELADFRSYGSFTDSFSDYLALISQNQRYSQAMSQSGNPQQYIHELQKAGYATDPLYTQKIMSIFNSEDLNAAIEEVGS